MSPIAYNFVLLFNPLIFQFFFLVIELFQSEAAVNTVYSAN